MSGIPLSSVRPRFFLRLPLLNTCSCCMVSKKGILCTRQQRHFASLYFWMFHEAKSLSSGPLCVLFSLSLSLPLFWSLVWESNNLQNSSQISNLYLNWTRYFQIGLFTWNNRQNRLFSIRFIVINFAPVSDSASLQAYSHKCHNQISFFWIWINCFTHVSKHFLVILTAV